jgi:predicted GNAT family N-acyltransferase
MNASQQTVEVNGHQLTFREATAGEVRPLRQDILIAGTDRTTAVFDGDDDPATRHFALFENDRMIACVSFMRTSAADGEGRRAWQLRGMAVTRDWQRRGVGSRLLLLAERAMEEIDPAVRFWCNAREAAAGFYERHGWRRDGKRFDIPGVGPHYRMGKAR